VERGSLLGAPTYAWIGARQRVSSTFTIFVTEVPDGFAGVRSVRREDSRIVISERGSARELTIVHTQN
jgi:hypothetical protein